MALCNFWHFYLVSKLSQKLLELYRALKFGELIGNDEEMTWLTAE